MPTPMYDVVLKKRMVGVNEASEATTQATVIKNVRLPMPPTDHCKIDGEEIDFIQLVDGHEFITVVQFDDVYFDKYFANAYKETIAAGWKEILEEVDEPRA